MMTALQAGVLYLCIIATFGVLLKVYQLWCEYMKFFDETLDLTSK